MPKFTEQQKRDMISLYSTFRALGYDDASIYGIMGNALSETGFDPNLSSKSLNFHGLLQNSTAIRNAITKMYGDHSFKNQMKYLHDWVIGSENVRNNADTLTNAGKYKMSGYKDAAEAAYEFMKLYERPVILDKNGKVVGYQKQNERMNNARIVADYMSSQLMPKMLKTRDGNKILSVNPAVYLKPEYGSTWKPEQSAKTIYPLNNTTPESISSWSGADAPNATPRLKDFLEVRQEDLNRGIDVYGDPVSPFSLSLRPPSLQNLLLNLTEQYFADILGISDMVPLTPSLFPRFADGKSPIHIKEKNRGKFTALKKRTGKSASWFKAHGTPAQKKMAIFALNARKWKH